MKANFVLCVMASVLLAGAVMAASAKEKKCQVCDPEACPQLNGANCLAGTTKDDCGCCDVCAKLEGQACDLKGNHDQCGDGMQCKDIEGAEPMCQCQFQEIMCGSDNKTYTNLCQLLATAVRERKTNSLKVKSVGPCDPGALILTKPEYVRNHTHSSVVLQCEAMGMPTPSMTWIFKRADGQVYNVPGDDNSVVASTRGGPGKYMVTSWLQINNLQKIHEGDYTCVAINLKKKDQATARIKVIERE